MYESYYNISIVSSSSDLKVAAARSAPLFTHKSCFLSACCVIIFAFCLDCIFSPALYSICVFIPFSLSLINLLLFTLHLSFNVYGVIFLALIFCAINWSFVFRNFTDCTNAPTPTQVLRGTSHHAIDGVQLRGMLGLSVLCFLLAADLLVIFQHLHYIIVSELCGIIDWEVPPPAQRWGMVKRKREGSRRENLHYFSSQLRNHDMQNLSHFEFNLQQRRFIQPGVSPINRAIVTLWMVLILP